MPTKKFNKSTIYHSYRSGEKIYLEDLKDARQYAAMLRNFLAGKAQLEVPLFTSIDDEKEFYKKQLDKIKDSPFVVMPVSPLLYTGACEKSIKVHEFNNEDPLLEGYRNINGKHVNIFFTFMFRGVCFRLTPGFIIDHLNDELNRYYEIAKRELDAKFNTMVSLEALGALMSFPGHGYATAYFGLRELLTRFKILNVKTSGSDLIGDDIKISEFSTFLFDGEGKGPVIAGFEHKGKKYFIYSMLDPVRNKKVIRMISKAFDNIRIRMPKKEIYDKFKVVLIMSEEELLAVAREALKRINISLPLR